MNSYSLKLLIIYLLYVIQSFSLKTKQLPFYFNWLEYKPDCIHSVRSSGKCNSSYAFSIASMLESRICIITGQETEISPQQLISCDTKNRGCNGGSIINSLNFAKSNGFTSEEDYKYTSQDGGVEDCHQYKRFVYTLSDIEKFDSQGPIMQEIMFNGPVSAEMNLYEDFLSFKGEIYKHQEGSKLIRKHNILIIGWIRENTSNEEFWIVKNSFGTDWGNKGYFKIKFGECDIESNVLSIHIDIK